jgi:FkbM family methyltransferase
MSLFRKLLGEAHHRVGHSHLGLLVAEKMRNQSEAILARAHGEECDLELNGEGNLLQCVAPSVSYFIDVGANKGNWTEAVLKLSPDAHGLLFDPSRSATDVLRKKFAHISQIEILESAVADKPGHLPFFEEDGAGETSSLIGNVSVTEKCRQVAITTIDSELGKRNWPRVDYLKIDAEGYDFLVLQGAKEILSKGHVHCGQFEYGPGWRYAGSTITYALKWMSNLGYECYLLTAHGLLQPNPERFREYFRYSNFVFVRADLKDSIMSLKQEAFFRALY